MTTVILKRNNQQPRRKRRGTVLNVSHCVFYKVVAVGFNTLCYDAKRRRKTSGIKPSARITLSASLPSGKLGRTENQIICKIKLTCPPRSDQGYCPAQGAVADLARVCMGAARSERASRIVSECAIR